MPLCMVGVVDLHRWHLTESTPVNKVSKYLLANETRHHVFDQQRRQKYTSSACRRAMSVSISFFLLWVLPCHKVHEILQQLLQCIRTPTCNKSNKKKKYNSSQTTSLFTLAIKIAIVTKWEYFTQNSSNYPFVTIPWLQKHLHQQSTSVK